MPMSRTARSRIYSTACCRKSRAAISYRAVRNYGTIGGSVALADPAADWPVCLLALGADVRVATHDGVRSQPIGDLIQGQYTTSLAKDEIILGFDVPPPDARLRWGYFKMARKSGAFANSIAMAVQRGGDGPVSVALGAAAARAFLLPAVADRVRQRRNVRRGAACRHRRKTWRTRCPKPIHI